jgi:hypothetical protein
MPLAPRRSVPVRAPQGLSFLIASLLRGGYTTTERRPSQRV